MGWIHFSIGFLVGFAIAVVVILFIIQKDLER